MFFKAYKSTVNFVHRERNEKENTLVSIAKPRHFSGNLIERAPLQHCWKRAGEEDEEEEDEEGSPVTTPLENDLLME